MGGLCVARALVTAVIGVTSICVNTPARAGDPAGFVPPMSVSQIMIFVSRPIMARGSAASTFGIRYERSSPGYPDSAARFSAPLRHHSLIELQFTRGAAPRMQFGPRVTWDMGRARLTPTSLATAVWPMSIQPQTAAAPALGLP